LLACGGVVWGGGGWLKDRGKAGSGGLGAGGGWHWQGPPLPLPWCRWVGKEWVGGWGCLRLLCWCKDGGRSSRRGRWCV
jgi:hypothetical protein